MSVNDFSSIEVINASAGTGKTYTLTARVYEEIENGLAPEQLMVTTFTNKAAAELRERIRLRLLMAGKSSAAQRIYDGLIGTVNGVCARLLIENALDAGLSPSLNILPEEDADQLFRVAVRNEIDLHADSVADAARRMQLGGGGGGGLTDWGAKVQRIVQLARANMISSEKLLRCGARSWATISELFGPPSREPLDEMLVEALDHAIAVYEDLPSMSITSKGALKVMKEVRRRSGDLLWADWVRLSKLEGSRETRGFLDELQDIASRVCSHPLFQQDVKLVLDTVFNCAAESLASFAEFKKRQGLMDFIDQEVQVLRMARENEQFREHLKSRVGKVLVDEFQDTSPIQLALFLELHTIVSASVWVGDPKQSIYGFRGTDAELMNSVARVAHEGQTLSESWRSKELLVRFTNAVFSAAFSEIGKDKVCLSIPQARAEQAEDGWLETWHLRSSSIAADLGSIATGVVDLLKRRPELRPGDIAVLCRRNDDVSKLASELTGLGVRASASQGSLLMARECRVVLAGLRYLDNPGNTVALAEMVRILGEGSAEWLRALVARPDETVLAWRESEWVQRVDALRKECFELTPVETVDALIDRVDLLERIKTWENSAKRVANIEAFRETCRAYLDRCASWRRPSSIKGMLAYLEALQPPQAEGEGDDAVHVLNYHKSKGLEWPVVIMASLDSDFGARVFEPGIVSAKDFDPRKPLEKRSILYWPWPFGSQRAYDALDEKVQQTDLWKAADRRELMESKRLLYVGMTRARDGLIFAIRKKVRSKDVALGTKWLDRLCTEDGELVIDWGLDLGNAPLQAGGELFPCLTIEYQPSARTRGTVEKGLAQRIYPSFERRAVSHPPARVSPSRIVYSSYDAIGVEELAKVGEPIAVRQQVDVSALGSAVHGFLGAEPGGLKGRELEAAGYLLKRWNVAAALSGEELVEIRERFERFVAARYPGARVLREWPISLRSEIGQLAQGWIDTLLELKEGYVVIDHKTYPGEDTEEKCKEFAPQLRIYREAVERATGQKVIDTLVHFPVGGKVFRVVDESALSWETRGAGVAAVDELW